MSGHSMLLNSFPLALFTIHSHSHPQHNILSFHSLKFITNSLSWYWSSFCALKRQFFTSNISHAFNERRESLQQWEWDWKKFFLMNIIDKEPTNRITSKPTYLLNAIARFLKCVYFIMIILQSILRKKRDEIFFCE